MYNLRDAHPAAPPRREDQPPPRFLWPRCTSPSLSVIQCGLRRVLRWRRLLKDSEFCQVCAACQGPGRGGAGPRVVTLSVHVLPAEASMVLFRFLSYYVVNKCSCVRCSVGKLNTYIKISSNSEPRPCSFMVNS